MSSARIFGLATGAYIAVALVSGAQAAAPTYTWSISSTFQDWGNMTWAYDPLGNNAPDGSASTLNYGDPSSAVDGGTVSGSFTVDGSGNLLSFNIVTTASSLSGNGIITTSQTYDSAWLLANSGSNVSGSNLASADLYGLLGTDVYFSDTSSSYILDLNLPTLTGSTTVGDQFANYGGVVTELAWNFDGDPSYQTYASGPYRYDFLGNNSGPQNNLVMALDGNNAPTYAATSGGTPAGQTTLTLVTVNSDTPPPPPSDTPEPLSLALLGTGLVGLGAIGRRFNRRKS